MMQDDRLYSIPASIGDASSINAASLFAAYLKCMRQRTTASGVGFLAQQHYLTAPDEVHDAVKVVRGRMQGTDANRQLSYGRQCSSAKPFMNS
jgi:hypothetical protein